MNSVHSLLKRQLRRFSDETIALIEEGNGFLRAINEAYWQFDEDRQMLEHSLELTSQELLEKNAELSRINAELEMRVAARTSELTRSEARFRGLFEHAPISIWEEDFSTVRKTIDDLRAAGVVDFSFYLEEHPEVVAECAAHVKIVDVNRTTLEMYGAENESELLADLSKVLGPESLPPFKAELLALARGETSFENETVNYTLRGERRDVFMRLTVAPGYEQTWAKIFVGISDITERRQAEAALAAERDLLQALMDNIPDTIYFKDTASRFTRINRAQARVLGVATPEKAIGKTDLDFFQEPALAKSFYEEEQRLFQTGESLINRIEFNPTPDGGPRWFSATKVPLKNESGQVIGMVGISHDITKRTLAEAAVQEAEAKYRTLVEHMPAVVYVDRADETRNTIYINSRVQEMLGYSPEDWVTKPDLCIDIVHPDDSERMWKELDESETRGRFACDYRYIAKDGRVVWVRDEAVLLKNEGERPSVWQGVMLDITAEKEAEEALRQSEERFKLIAWATKDAVWDWDLRTNQIWWGDGLQKIFHYSSETAQSSAEWRLEHIHPEDRAKVTRVIDQALEGGMEFWSKEYLFQKKDSTYAAIMDRGYIIRDDTGKPYRMIGAMMDITERKYMESTLRQTNEQMRQFLDELQRRNSEIALLNEMSRLLQASQTAEEAYKIIGDLSNQLFPHTTGALYLLNTQRTLVSAVASWGELPSVEQILAPDDCWALYRGQTHPLKEDKASLPCLHLSEPLPAVSYCLPMQVQGEILGMLHVRSQHEENLDEAKRQLAYAVVEHSGMALSNLKLRAALREQSIRDPLTGLYNRRYMEEALNQQLSRVTRHLHPLGIMMIDIDHFKNFNDVHGHAAGDLLLRQIGKFLQSHVRGEDIACRYGGEEFILIMPDVSLEVAKYRAEHLWRDARQIRVQENNQYYEGITLSLGVAIYPLHGRTIETVIRAADAALYHAKQEGRDRVVVADKTS
jgi:diguanylate cyclase (GGDEF)-like protein/PAS domain S-box-containing protein